MVVWILIIRSFEQCLLDRFISGDNFKFVFISNNKTFIIHQIDRDYLEVWFYWCDLLNNIFAVLL